MTDAKEEDIPGTAIFAEGDNVKQNITNATINVVGGDQILSTIREGAELKTNQTGKNGNATFVDGDRINIEMSQCTVNVVSGNQYITSRDRREESSLHPPILHSSPNWIVHTFKRASGGYLSSFKEKIRRHAWENVQGKVMESYNDYLMEPEKEFYPQLKIGFELYKGGYVPLEGFSAHCHPKQGSYFHFEELLKLIKNYHHRAKAKPYVIIGQPGSGKTIMMKRLAKKLIVASKLHQDCSRKSTFSQKTIRQYDIVLHMNIRDIPNQEGATLCNVIFSPQVTRLSAIEARYGLDAILEGKVKTIMFFDGLDQATWLPDCENIIGPWEISNTATIFGNILSGHILKNITIVISSREHSVALLRREMRPKFVAALVGFSEKEAKSLYCNLMGSNAERDWDSMKISHPGIHFMCLTPLFLIFYMIARKRDPLDPPDCASGVMTRIIQILLESDNARNINEKTDVASVLNKLKEMAFNGTKEQRVLFTHRDLERCNLQYSDINDIMIKVPGLNILGQKILEGMYRLFFSHQTLQEVLSALYLSGMDLPDFKQTVDSEFTKPYWSVVRNFTSGILNNDRVSTRISDEILKSADLRSKADYLMKNLEDQLSDGNLSPAQRLDVLTSLKEADALNLLQTYGQDLDLSNYPLNPAVMSILCSVIGNMKSLNTLSLSNCNVDEEFLALLAYGTRGLQVKIDKFDARGNTSWAKVDHWQHILENLKVDTFCVDIPGDSEIKVLQLTLWATAIPIERWQRTIERITFDVERCFLQCMQNSRAKFAFEIAHATRVNLAQEVYLLGVLVVRDNIPVLIRKDFPFKIDDIIFDHNGGFCEDDGVKLGILIRKYSIKRIIVNNGWRSMPQTFQTDIRRGHGSLEARNCNLFISTGSKMTLLIRNPEE